MNIGFDAKRAFHNTTGLGNYSRTLITGLAQFYPQHQYFLFNPKPSKKFPKPPFENVHEVLPGGFVSKKFSSLWRSKWVIKDLQQWGIQLYHGLSHEIPVGIEKTAIPSVVTIHDLIFERYPEQFSKIDVQIFRKKFRYACQHANRIIAISKQTGQDIVEMYGIDADKIDICYQSCDPAFAEQVDEKEKELIRERFGLPSAFFLYVGSIIERKNLLNICKALQLMPELPVPLVVIGDGKAYKNEVKAYIAKHNLAHRVIFLSETHAIGKDARTLAAIYQMSLALIYPSFFEGFGIPVLEALWSRVPVITSATSCLPETGGDAALYIDPSSAEQIAQAMQRVYNDESLREQMIAKGLQHAQNFTLENCTKQVMDVYKKLVNGGSI
jgi:glycosyltransferase involved in cell wall biosynthesis